MDLYKFKKPQYYYSNALLTMDRLDLNEEDEE